MCRSKCCKQLWFVFIRRLFSLWVLQVARHQPEVGLVIDLVNYPLVLCSCRSPAPKRARIVEELRAGDVLCLKGDLQFHHVAKGRGPRAAIAKTGLSKCTQADRMVWLESARLEAVLGGMRLSMPSVCSGLRCYVAFVGSSLCHIRTLLDVFRACWQMQSARVPSYIFHHPSMS